MKFNTGITLRVAKWICVSLLPAWVLGQIPDGYYDAAAGLSGSALKSALHAIISDHTRYPYTSTSTDVWDILKDTDEDPENSENVILIYTGRSQLKNLNSGETSDTESNLWNREHLWSKSHGFPNETDTAYTDIHHLRPADESVNSTRNTLDFDNGGAQHPEATECFYDSDSWEPRDAAKGDIARAMFYMVVRYDPGYHTDNSVYDLELVDYTGTQTYEPLFGKLSTLMQWHVQDPVDDFETHRNEVVFGYQGNRNPFIDHPEWVSAIFNEQLGSQTQVGFTSSSLIVEEDAGTIQIGLAILNPDPDQATQCLVVLSGGSGDADDLNGFEFAQVTFPAGSSDLRTIPITIIDDDLAEDRETFIFNIAEVTGGDSVTVNGNNTFVLTLNPSDQHSALPGLIISEVMDGNRAGGSPKYIELTNISQSSLEIGGLQIWRGSNGGDPIHAVDIPLGATLFSGASWVLAYSAGDMANAGFSAPDQSSSAINGNGNDVYQLRTADSDLIDAFGLVGTETVWYENSVVTRLPSINGTRSNYNPAEWEFIALQVGEPNNGSPGTPGFHVVDPTETHQSLQPDREILISVFPNPFNGSVHIQISSALSKASVTIFDLQGHPVRSLARNISFSGDDYLVWNGLDDLGQALGSGIYLIYISSPQIQQLQRITLLK